MSVKRCRVAGSSRQVSRVDHPHLQESVVHGPLLRGSRHLERGLPLLVQVEVLLEAEHGARHAGAVDGVGGAAVDHLAAGYRQTARAGGLGGQGGGDGPDY